MIGVNIVAGLCNRIFQMVFAYSFAKKYNLQFKFENWERRSHHSPQVYNWLIERFMKLPNYINTNINYKHSHIEKDTQFTEYIDYYSDIKDKINENIIIYGFFQNEKYFKDYREDILELLKEPEYVTEKINKEFPLEYLENSYFMHIRLGDYIGCKKHWVNLENYYINILKQLEHEKKNIIIFSNMVHLISRIYPNLCEYVKTINHVVIGDSDEVLNLYLMARCKCGGISSNSTFGWWGAWLNTNPNKKIFFPSQWMGYTEYNIDIYPENCIIIPV